MNTEAAQILDQVQTLPTEAPTENTVDTKTEVKTEAPIKDDRISSRLDILIRREQAAVNRERAAKLKEAEVEAKLKRYEDFESAKTSPDKALELLGLNYDELTRTKLNDGEIPPEVRVKQVEDKFEAYRKSQEETEKKRTEEYKLEQERHAKAQEEKAIGEFKGELNTYLKDNSERYEYVNFEGQDGYDLVFDVIDTHYNRSLQESFRKLVENGEDQETAAKKAVGKVMTKEEAADKVEAHYEKREFEKRKLKKSQSIWGAIPKEIQKEVAKQTNKPSQSPKTLTNQLSANPTAPRKAPVTDEERVQRAIAYAKSLRG